MDLSTLVYILGAVAYWLLKGQFKSKPRPLPGPLPNPNPAPGPLAFPPAQPPLPLPRNSPPARPIYGQFNSGPSNSKPSRLRPSNPGKARPVTSGSSPTVALFREGSSRFSASESLSAPTTSHYHADPPAPMEYLDNPAGNDSSDATSFRLPDPKEWRRAIILSTLLEPRFDRRLDQ
jgi:hypothetical protein